MPHGVTTGSRAEQLVRLLVGVLCNIMQTVLIKVLVHNVQYVSNVGNLRGGRGWFDILALFICLFLAFN